MSPTNINHSPLPWNDGGHPKDKSGTEWRQILCQSPFGPCYVGQALKEDSDLIIRAVNSHYQLVEALEEMIRADADLSATETSPLGKARAALELAKKGAQ